MIYRALSLLISTLALSSAEATGGFWCAESGLARKANSTRYSSQQLSFRGEYRDFSLVVEDDQGMLPECSTFKVYIAGNDGLWVIEEPDVETADKTKASLISAGLPVYYAQGASFVVGGGSEVPNVSGLDGCGADEDTSFIPVPSHNVQPPVLSKKIRQEWSARDQEKNPDVELAVSLVTEESLVNTVSLLQSFETRNSYSEILPLIGQTLGNKLIELGFEVEYFQFRSDMAPNVVASWPGDYSEWVVAGAHYDSRTTNSSSPSDRAPGADDNGSGVAAMFQLATIMSATKLPLNRGLRVIFFAGEEQGLLGSRALAAVYKERNEPIVAMVNADMLGYQATDTVTLGFKDKSVTPELVELAKALTALYVPGLPTADSSSCCSDYLAFFENGFAAVGFFENGMAASNYPSYHTSTDLLTNINTKQLTLETQAVVATVFTLVL